MKMARLGRLAMACRRRLATSALASLLFRREKRPDVALADVLFLDADLLGVGDNHVERAAADDRDVLFAVTGEGELESAAKDLYMRGGRTAS